MLLPKLWQGFVPVLFRIAPARLGGRNLSLEVAVRGADLDEPDAMSIAWRPSSGTRGFVGEVRKTARRYSAWSLRAPGAGRHRACSVARTQPAARCAKKVSCQGPYCVVHQARRLGQARGQGPLGDPLRVRQAEVGDHVQHRGRVQRRARRVMGRGRPSLAVGAHLHRREEGAGGPEGRRGLQGGAQRREGGAAAGHATARFLGELVEQPANRRAEKGAEGHAPGAEAVQQIRTEVSETH